MQIIFIGPAGSGKTCLVKKFGEWLEANTDSTLSIVNLDPGCIEIPYEHSFDIRKYFTLEQIMRKEKLGPSGAMVKGAELTEKYMNEIINNIRKNQSDYILIDTPGQSEIFVFQPSGPAICDHLKRISPTISVHIIDALTARNGINLAAALSLSLASQLRLGIPTVNVLNKFDLIKNSKIEKMLCDYEFFKDEIKREKSGTVTGLAMIFVDTIKNLTTSQRTVKVSAKTGEGMEQLLDLINESLCECGDLS